MYNINFQEIKDVDYELVKKIVELERRNLGKDASVNEWIIPVIIRYGKLIVAKREKEPLREEIRENKCSIKEEENSMKKGSKKKSGDSEIIGVCEIISSWREENAAFIHSFYIDKKYRNKGIGKRLMQKVIDILKNDNIKIIELTVDPENRAANRLYSKYGFKRAGFRKDEYGKGVDRNLMVLKL